MMKKPDSTDTQDTSFESAFRILQRNAQRLEQGEAGIDELVELVEESMQAYRQCRERVTRIEQALDQMLKDEETDNESEIH